MSRIRAAVIGLGYWGPNLARNFQVSDDFELVAVCERAEARLAKVGGNFPSAKRFSDVAAMLKEAKPELVAVATPVGTHRALVLAALEAGCDVLCEKPLADSVKDAAELVETAARLGRKLFVDHTFVYTGAVRALRRMYESGRLGDLFYVDSVRINLGLFQPDVDVIWDLAPHDLSIINHVIQRKAISVRAHGSSHNPRDIADVAYLSVEYEGGLTAHMHLSWLSPVKVRRMIFSGTKSSAIYDDLEASEKIKVYDHGVSFDVADLETRSQVQVNYRRGDMHAPAIDNLEALSVETREIARAMRGGALPDAMDEHGLAIVRVLEAATKSLANDGNRIVL